MGGAGEGKGQSGVLIHSGFGATDQVLLSLTEITREHYPVRFNYVFIK